MPTHKVKKKKKDVCKIGENTNNNNKNEKKLLAKKRKKGVFLLHLVVLLQNVYIMMLIYAEGNGSFFVFVLLRKWIDCSIVSVPQLMGPNAHLTYNEFKTKFETGNHICCMRVYWLQLRTMKKKKMV